MWLCLVIKSLHSSLEEKPGLGKSNEAPFSSQWLKAKTQSVSYNSLLINLLKLNCRQCTSFA